MSELKPKRRSILLIASILVVSLTATVMLSQRQRLRTLSPPVGQHHHERLSGLPHIILWAWERPESLKFINTKEVGVAFLARTLYLRGERVVARPRLQTLDVPEGTALVAVARIESDRTDRPALSQSQITQAADEIARLAKLPGINAIQIDFDATRSERNFYRDLLRELRHRLPESTALSITALASWCTGDDWVSDLPVDEAVPMLFRMGVDQRQIVSHLAAGGSFRPSLCRSSSGVSTDEPLMRLPPAARLYVFSPEVWSPEAVRKIVERYRNEHEDS